MTTAALPRLEGGRPVASTRLHATRRYIRGYEGTTMNVYLLSGCSRGSLIAVKYHATLAGAHANAKEASYPSDRREIRIDLIDVGTDKATVLRMLNAEGGYQVGGVQRSWSVTDRGGLVEVKVGD